MIAFYKASYLALYNIFKAPSKRLFFVETKTATLKIALIILSIMKLVTLFVILIFLIF